MTNKTTANAAEIVNVQNTITDIILRDTNQDSRLKAIEDNYANKADVVTLSEQQTITGPKTFTEHIYLANSDGTVDRISHLNNNFIIHSGATNAAVLNIDEGLSKGDFDYVLRIGTLMVVMVVIGAFFGIQSGRHAAIASTGLAKNLRSALFGKVQSFSFKNIDKLWKFV